MALDLVTGTFDVVEIEKGSLVTSTYIAVAVRAEVSTIELLQKIQRLFYIVRVAYHRKHPSRVYR